MKIRSKQFLIILLILLLLTVSGAAFAESESKYVWEHPVPYNLETEIAVEEKVAELAALCKASDASGDYEIALWMHDWLIHNADYDETYTEYGADGVLLKGTGVCESYTLAFGLLLDKIGIENKQVRSSAMDHTWNLVKLEGKWYHVDCTWDDPIGGGAENHGYFGLSDALMRRDHTWDDASSLPACTSTDCHYYMRSGEADIVSSQEELSAAIDRHFQAGNPRIRLYNLSTDGFDLTTALYTWLNKDSWRYNFDNYLTSFTGFTMILEFQGCISPIYSVEYRTTAELESKLLKAFDEGVETINVIDCTDEPFNSRSLMFTITDIANAYCTKYAYELAPNFELHSTYRCITMHLIYDEFIASGECGMQGNNIVWELDRSGILTLSGSGETDSWYDRKNYKKRPTPWQDYSDQIERVVIGDGITCIGNMAFLNCAALEFVELPDTLLSIGYSTFEGCSKLQNITLPNGLTHIDEYAFSNCISLTQVILPDGITKVSYAAFENCQHLSHVTLPKNLTIIDGWAFWRCISLTEIVLPDGITEIGYAAFDGCSALGVINFPDSLNFIDEHGFSDCPSLTKVVISGSSYPAYTFHPAPENLKIYCNRGSNIETWAHSNGYPVAYLIDPNMPKLILPDDVTAIADEAFVETAAEYIILSDWCTTIGSRAFADCRNLLYIWMPDSIQTIASDAFFSCDDICFICESDNAAAAFAKQNGIDYTLQEPMP